MKSACIAAAAAFAAQSVSAGPAHYPTTVSSGYSHNHAAKADVVAVPTIVDRSNETKTCPDGFFNSGKECAMVQTVTPDTSCPSGTMREGPQCTRYSNKIVECPPMYTLTLDGQCEKFEKLPPTYICPADYTQTADITNCAIQVANMAILVCPPGTIAKGELCATEVESEPQLLCPPNAILIGKRCRSEITFDCTPERKITPAIASAMTYVEPEEPHTHSGHTLRSLEAKHRPSAYTTSYSSFSDSTAKHATKDKSTIGRPYTTSSPTPTRIATGKSHPAEIEEYVVQTTCKRIHQEDARKLCADGSRLYGKVCISEEYSAPISKAMGFHEEYTPARLSCPLGYEQSEPWNSRNTHTNCVKLESIPATSYCPGTTIDAGNRCVEYRPLITSCPASYKLENGTCSKTVYAPPTIEYTIKYQCTGKDCVAPATASVPLSYTSGHKEGHAHKDL